MIKYRCRWFEHDFMSLKETNLLYDFVVLYGAYVSYKETTNNLSKILI